MIKEIDFSSLREFITDPFRYDEVVEFALSKLQTELVRVWGSLARDSLKAARKEYISSLEADDKGKFVKGIILRGWLPNAIEDGIGPFDMKAGFEGSSKKKTYPGGWYLTIPKRHGTPGTVSFDSVLPKEVYKSIYAVPEEYKVKTVRQRIYDQGKLLYDQYESKSNIFDGLKRINRLGGGSQYVTFRRVSSKSDPESWIHSGIQARHFMEQALSNMNLEAELNNAVDEIMNR